ncbi:MAG: hypothetical protein HY664_07755 [Chloroflexi bacterium]|nr:hypothetical protein [Chloroflexota bacterium]
MAKAKYLVELPHTNEECLQAMDEVAAKGSKFLPKVYWGCMSGIHTGWAPLEAKSEEEVRNLITGSLVRNKARITKVDQFTEKQVASFHKV